MRSNDCRFRRHQCGDVPPCQEPPGVLATLQRVSGAAFTRQIQGDQLDYRGVRNDLVLGTTFRLPRADIAPGLAAIVKIEAIRFDHRQAILDALDLWVGQGPLSFADCYHLVLTRTLGLDTIFTFDTKLDRYPGVERVEP